MTQTLSNGMIVLIIAIGLGIITCFYFCVAKPLIARFGKYLVRGRDSESRSPDADMKGDYPQDPSIIQESEEISFSQIGRPHVENRS